MGRSPISSDKNGLKKGPWTQEEDLKLIQYIQVHGPGNWRSLPKNAGMYINSIIFPPSQFIWWCSNFENQQLFRLTDRYFVILHLKYLNC